eukprot:Rmarinus@m.26046
MTKTSTTSDRPTKPGHRHHCPGMLKRFRNGAKRLLWTGKHTVAKCVPRPTAAPSSPDPPLPALSPPPLPALSTATLPTEGIYTAHHPPSPIRDESWMAHTRTRITMVVLPLPTLVARNQKARSLLGAQEHEVAIPGKAAPRRPPRFVPLPPEPLPGTDDHWQAIMRCIKARRSRHAEWRAWRDSILIRHAELDEIEQIEGHPAPAQASFAAALRTQPQKGQRRLDVVVDAIFMYARERSYEHCARMERNEQVPRWKGWFFNTVMVVTMLYLFASLYVLPAVFGLMCSLCRVCVWLLSLLSMFFCLELVTVASFVLCAENFVGQIWI